MPGPPYEPPLLHPDPPRGRRPWPAIAVLALVACVGGWQWGGLFYAVAAGLGGALFGLAILPKARSGAGPLPRPRLGDSGGNDGSSE